MKGFVVALMLSIGLSLCLKANANETKAYENLKPSDIIGLSTIHGEVFIAREKEEKLEIAEGLKSGERIEISGSVVYPEEILKVLTRNLTSGKIVEKKPNQPDFN